MPPPGPSTPPACRFLGLPGGFRFRFLLLPLTGSVLQPLEQHSRPATRFYLCIPQPGSLRACVPRYVE